jgi:hypothetical protein
MISSLMGKRVRCHATEYRAAVQSLSFAIGMCAALTIFAQTIHSFSYPNLPQHTMKNLFLMSLGATFVLVWMAMSPSLKGMDFSTQLSYVANQTMQHINDMLSPLMDMYYRYFY